MTQYGYLKTIYLSFYSSNLYRDVARNWSGLGVVFYLFLLLLVTWTIFMLHMRPIINQEGVDIANLVVPQLPDAISIRNGVVRTPQNRPYIIKDKDDNNEIIAIVDTSGKYKTLSQANTKILLTKDYFYHENSDGVVQISKIPSNINFDVTQDFVKKSVIKFFDWMWLGLFPFVFVGSFIYRIVQSFLYAILGKLAAIIMGQSIYYETVLKLTMVALTPAIIVATILEWTHIYFSHMYYLPLFYFVLTMGYMIFAVRANRVSEI